MPKQYGVRLTDAERESLHRLVQKPRVSAPKARRARVLLQADAAGPDWTDAKLAEAFDCRTPTGENLRERRVTEGFATARNGKPPQRVRGKVLDGEPEAQLIALRLGQPPPGFAHWTLRLLAEQAVTLEIVESVSHETLRRMLKKAADESHDRVLGNPTRRGCRVRREQGGSAGRLRPTLRFPVSGVVQGRAADAVVARDANADRRHEKASPTGGLRLRACGDGAPVYVLRTAFGMASGIGAGPTNHGGLGAGGRGVVANPLRVRRTGDPGLR